MNPQHFNHESVTLTTELSPPLSDDCKLVVLPVSLCMSLKLVRSKVYVENGQRYISDENLSTLFLRDGVCVHMWMGGGEVSVHVCL